MSYIRVRETKPNPKETGLAHLLRTPLGGYLGSFSPAFFLLKRPSGFGRVAQSPDRPEREGTETAEVTETALGGGTGSGKVLRKPAPGCLADHRGS